MKSSVNKLPRVQVTLTPTDKPREWMLTKPLYYDNIIVPKGFVTDLASIPLVFRWLFPHGGPRAAAAVLHDYLYRTPEICDSKKYADRLFLAALKRNKAKYPRLLYTAVRLFGSHAFNKRRK